MVVDLESQQVVQTILYKSPAGLFLGVAFSPDGKHAYASGQAVLNPTTGETAYVIHVYNVEGQHLSEVAPIVLAPATYRDPTGQLHAFPYFNPAGLAVSADGRTLSVADNLADSLSEVKLNADGVTGVVLPPVKVGHNPYTVVLSGDGRTAYVSNWGESTVSILNVAGAAPVVVKTITVGIHPNAMALNPKAGELYVANADSDTISVINTATNLIIRKINLAPYFGARVGASPDGLAVSPDGETLYVTNATDNDVAVIRLAAPGSLNEQGAHDQVKGLIPTGWFPAGVIVSPEGDQFYVINAKGLGAGPNPQGPNPYKDSESGPDQYIGSMMVGTLSIIDVPDEDQLQQYTKQVFANNHFPDQGDDDGKGQDDNGGKRQAIDTITPAASTGQSLVERLLDGGAGFGGDAGGVSALIDTLMAQLSRFLESRNGGLPLRTADALPDTSSSAGEADTDPLAGLGQAKGEQAKDSQPNHHRRGPNKLGLDRAEDDLTA
jgi:YVTN family beta-propeller protein